MKESCTYCTRLGASCVVHGGNKSEDVGVSEGHGICAEPSIGSKATPDSSLSPIYSKPVCRGSILLGSACGVCERCEDEKRRIVQATTPTQDRRHYQGGNSGNTSDQPHQSGSGCGGRGGDAAGGDDLKGAIAQLPTPQDQSAKITAPDVSLGMGSLTVLAPPEKLILHFDNVEITNFHGRGKVLNSHADNMFMNLRIPGQAWDQIRNLEENQHSKLFKKFKLILVEE